MRTEGVLADLEKIFWIVNVSGYEELRNIKGCEKLIDLKATTTDCHEIVKMAKSFGVKDEYIFRDEEATYKSMNKTYSEILKLSRKWSSENQ